MKPRLTLIIVAMFICAGVFLVGVPLQTVSTWFAYALFALAAAAVVEIGYFAWRSRAGDRWRKWGSGFIAAGLLGLGLLVHYGTVLPGPGAIALMVLATLLFLGGSALQTNAVRKLSDEEARDD